MEKLEPEIKAPTMAPIAPSKDVSGLRILKYGFIIYNNTRNHSKR